MKLEQANQERYDIVVMVQGDEPMTHPDMIAEAVQPLLDDPDPAQNNDPAARSVRVPSGPINR